VPAILPADFLAFGACGLGRLLGRASRPPASGAELTSVDDAGVLCARGTEQNSAVHSVIRDVPVEQV
jgi:hypothetical protein